MEKIEFEVQGSEAQPYNVVFTKNDHDISAHCSCRAGQVGLYCKHRIRIIMGEDEGVVSHNLQDIHAIREWYSGTDVEAAIKALRKAETHLEEAKSEVAKQKKRLAIVLRK
ncbi:MAG: hypothetical protein HGB21_01470 [Nitrospirae bacterium]|nr:hypothetical protein [Nitrospirota bacterium]